MENDVSILFRAIESAALHRSGHSDRYNVSCYYSAQMNIGLGVFNLIPFPPLDGSNVLEQIYPKVAYFYARIRPYRTLILVVLLMSGALSYPMNSVGNWLFRLMWTIVSALMGIDSGGATSPAVGTYV